MAELPDEFQRQLAIAEAAAAEKAKRAEAAKPPVFDTRAKIGELLVAAEYTASVAFHPNLERGPAKIFQMKMERTVREESQRRWFRRGPDIIIRPLGEGVIVVHSKISESAAQGYDAVPERTGLTLRHNGELYRYLESYDDAISQVMPSDESLLLSPIGEGRSESELFDAALSGLAQLAVAAQAVRK